MSISACVYVCMRVCAGIRAPEYICMYVGGVGAGGGGGRVVKCVLEKTFIK